jgi:hypothetical protein
MEAQKMRQLLPGGRKQQRLADLHRAVSGAVQGLHKHQLVVVTALRGTDVTLQQAVLEAHRLRVEQAKYAVETLGAFVERCRSRASVDIEPEPAVRRTG